MSELKLSTKQKSFLKSGLAKINIVWGTSGSGKSWVANLKEYYLLTGYTAPGSLVIYTGVTSETLYDNVVRKLLDIDKSIGDLQYKNYRLYVRGKDIEVACIGADNDRAANRIQGKNAVRWYADEITKQPKSVVEMCLMRLRSEVDGKLRTMPATWTLNADNPSHYIKTDYLDKADGQTIVEWAFDKNDNPIADEEYWNEQKNRYSGIAYKRMFENKWVVSEGIVYDRFTSAEHVVPIGDHLEQKLLASAKRWFMGVDWGYEHPLVLLLIADLGDDRYFVSDEIYVKHQLIDSSLWELVKNKGWLSFNPTQAYCDSARPEYLETFFNLSGKTIQCWNANKSVQEGIQAVQRHLTIRPNGDYGVYFSKRCVETIKEVELYSWARGREGISKDEPDKSNDHAMDALRYGIYTDSLQISMTSNFASLGSIGYGR